MMLQLICTK